VTGRPPTAGGALADFVLRHPRLLVLTGAGCSTASGIPDYRDADGRAKHPRPVLYADFVWSLPSRRRYWARSLRGWPRVAQARPNAAQRALAWLEARGRVGLLVTQNVDGLHQRAGSRAVVDLHGRLDVVVCLECGARSTRAALQESIAASNGGWNAEAATAPDGDADIDASAIDSFVAPRCDCGGLLKPDVVFFGENVPSGRYTQAREALGSADALLVAGSSLMVYSGFRFVRLAREAGLPIAIVNRGRTRGDDFAELKIEGDVGSVLTDAIAALT
jgi:NAD-dependent SIR2 family protein deacetylase